MLPLVYCCISDEIGEGGTYHTHVYFVCSSAISFGKVKKLFPTAHIDIAYGTAKEVRDYVFKDGKWLDDKKADTNLRDTHFEYGKIPEDVEIIEKIFDHVGMFRLVREGYSIYDIAQKEREWGRYMDEIYRMRDMIYCEKHPDGFKHLPHHEL
jgi:hypothetical protein